MRLGVIHKRRPQGGGVKGKGTRADIGGGGPQKILKKVSKKT